MHAGGPRQGKGGGSPERTRGRRWRRDAREQPRARDDAGMLERPAGLQPRVSERRTLGLGRGFIAARRVHQEVNSRLRGHAPAELVACALGQPRHRVTGKA